MVALQRLHVSWIVRIVAPPFCFAIVIMPVACFARLSLGWQLPSLGLATLACPGLPLACLACHHYTKNDVAFLPHLKYNYLGFRSLKTLIG
jgi:hypothetical protein